MEKKFGNKWKKILKKNVGKKYFETNISITKMYDTINQYDTIFALLAPLDRNRERQGVVKKWYLFHFKCPNFNIIIET